MSLEFRQFEPARDMDGVIDLVYACYGSNGVSREKFQHWHFKHEGLTQGMVLALDGERIVGMQPMEILPHWFQGELQTAAMLTGVMVDPEYRRRGIFNKLVTTCEELAWAKGALLVWTMPNDRSFPGFQKRAYAIPSERRLFIWAPRPGRVLESYLPNWASSVLTPLMRPYLSRRVDPSHGQSLADGSSIEECCGISEKLGAAWPGIMLQRDRRWFDWRYHSYNGVYEFAVDRSPNAASWSAITLEEREGLRVGYLVDHVGTDKDALWASGQAALGMLQDRGADLVMAVVSSSRQAESLERLGMRHVPRSFAPKRFFTVYKLNPNAPAAWLAKLQDPDAWYLSLSDWDTI